jgi:exodeoxyribonuclease-3
MNFVVLCWNVQNPSIERAGKQFLWLRKQPANIFVLTECKRSEGCLFLERCFQTYGYRVIFPKPMENEYGVLVASKDKLTPSIFSEHLDYLPTRVNSVIMPYFNAQIEVIGLYAPSRGFDTGERKDKKKHFLSSFLKALGTAPIPALHRILCGDFNILEPEHIPHYMEFEDWEYYFYCALEKYQLQDAFRYLHPAAKEYSWFGRSGDGYRYDHCFVSPGLVPLIDQCYYLHEPRELKLSDHSAMITILKLKH